MGKIKNVSFIESYILLERAADTLMKRKGDGISAYIQALERQKQSAAVADTLKFLKKCRIVRNKLAHDPGALKENSEITAKDTRRVKRLTAKIQKKKDPLSKLLIKRERLVTKIKLAVFAIAVITLLVTVLILNAR